MVNLTLAHLAVFPALQNAFHFSISLFRRYVIRMNQFMPGNCSNIRAVGDAGEEERDGAYHSLRQITFFPQKHFICFIS